MLITAGIDINKNNACSINFLRTVHSFSELEGNEVILCIPQKKSNLLSIVESKKIIKKSGYCIRKIPNSINFLINIPFILNSVNKEKVDIVYIRYNLMSLLLIAVLRVFSKAYIVTEHHGWIEDELKSLGKSKIVSWIFKKCQIWDVKMSHLARVVIDGIKEKLTNHGIKPEKIIVFQNGTDLSLFNNPQIKKHNDSNEYVIGFVGNLASWQGLDVALRAMSLLVMKRKDVKLHVIGDGPEKKNLEQLSKNLNLQDYIHFYGEVSIDAVPELLSGFDVAIAPFISERNQSIGLSPIKIRDYAASGLAIISSDIKGISEYDWLIKVKPNDPQDLAEHIELLIENEPLRKSLQVEAKKYAMNHFDVKKITGYIMKTILDNRNKQSR